MPTNMGATANPGNRKGCPYIGYRTNLTVGNIVRGRISIVKSKKYTYEQSINFSILIDCTLSGMINLADY